MTNESILKRLNELHNVLVYCTEVDTLSFGSKKVFTVGERIHINQERGALFTNLAANNNEVFPHEVRVFKVNAHIENKIQKTINQVQSTTWGGYDQNEILK